MLFALVSSALKLGPEEQIKKEMVNDEFENFMKAYSHIRKWEGNYSDLEHDAGGETYAGITRRFNKNWKGWEELDKFKKTNGVKWNSFVPEMEVYVKSYYHEKWKKGHYDKINDNIVAAYLFDYANSGNVAIKHTQRILMKHGHDVKLNYRMDMRTVNAINKMNPEIFLMELKTIRKQFYINVTLKKPETEIFLKGWIKRAESIIS